MVDRYLSAPILEDTLGLCGDSPHLAVLELVGPTSERLQELTHLTARNAGLAQALGSARLAKSNFV
jgi:hypothetical protein